MTNDRGARTSSASGSSAARSALALRERGWHVTGDDIDRTAVERGARRGRRSTRSGSIPTPTITFVATPVLAVADQVKRALAETTGRRHRRRQRQGADRRGDRRSPVRRRPPDGRQRARRPRRRRRRRMFEGAVWVLTPTVHTADATFARVAAVVAELGAEVVALPPERHDQVVAVDQPRAAPHRGDADGPGQRARRGARRAAAPGGRRLPRHDPHRRRAIRRSGSTSAPRTATPILVGARRPDRRAAPRCATVVADDDRAALHDRLQHAREARANLPSRVNAAERAGRGAHPDPRPPGCRGRGVHARRRARRQHRQLRGGAQRRGQPRRRRRARRRRHGRAVPRRADGPRLPPRRATARA